MAAESVEELQPLQLPVNDGVLPEIVIVQPPDVTVLPLVRLMVLEVLEVPPGVVVAGGVVGLPADTCVQVSVA